MLTTQHKNSMFSLEHLMGCTLRHLWYSAAFTQASHELYTPTSKYWHEYGLWGTSKEHLVHCVNTRLNFVISGCLLVCILCECIGAAYHAQRVPAPTARIRIGREVHLLLSIWGVTKYHLTNKLIQCMPKSTSREMYYGSCSPWQTHWHITFYSCSFKERSARVIQEIWITYTISGLLSAHPWLLLLRLLVWRIVLLGALKGAVLKHLYGVKRGPLSSLPQSDNPHERR